MHWLALVVVVTGAGVALTIVGVVTVVNLIGVVVAAEAVVVGPGAVEQSTCVNLQRFGALPKR